MGMITAVSSNDARTQRTSPSNGVERPPPAASVAEAMAAAAGAPQIDSIAIPMPLMAHQIKLINFLNRSTGSQPGKRMVDQLNRSDGNWQRSTKK